MNISRAWEFAEVERFYERFEPASPYGRQEKERREILVDKKHLEEIYSLTESAEALLARDKTRCETLIHHLKRLPLLPPLAGRTYDATEVFLVKKFLLNCRAIATRLDAAEASTFGLLFSSSALIEELCRGGDGAEDETFYLSESYAPELAAIRSELRLLDDKIKSARRTLTELILEETGLDLRFRDFVLVEAERARTLPSNLVTLEPYDSTHFVVRAVLPPTLLDASSVREHLIKREKEEEARVLVTLSGQIALHAETLTGYMVALTKLDTALARAQLAAKYRLVKPELEGGFPETTQTAAILTAHGARLLPLEWRCAENRLRYWPLNITMNHRANAIFGSNMGGKTVVLKTLVFLQIIAQMGFFVPATRFQSRIFRQIGYVGALGSGSGPSETIEGLSGFGSEIHAFLTEWQHHKSPMLLAIDEFARTTNSREASALVSALLNSVTEEPKVLALVSTHFMDLRLPRNKISLFRMKGLNREAYHDTFSTAAKGSLTTRIHAINQFMQYELVEEQNLAPVQDAITIAELLGLDPHIVEFARELLGEHHVGKTGTKP
jgi:dsDNA-specific endonuclease/ATPase MutS2